MVSRSVHTEAERTLLFRLIKQRKLPFSIEIKDGRKRSIDQNRLVFLWYGEIAEQLGDRTLEEVRGHCKLHHGVPILRAENPDFREAYDRVIRPLPYPDKLLAMMVPLDMPVTRIMKVSQLTTYLNAIEQEFLPLGVALTSPERRAA